MNSKISPFVDAFIFFTFSKIQHATSAYSMQKDVDV